jgi:hypothetical protein
LDTLYLQRRNNDFVFGSLGCKHLSINPFQGTQVSFERGIVAGPEVIVSCATEYTNKIRILQLLHLGSKIGFVAASEMETRNTIQDHLTRSARVRNERGDSVGGSLKDDETEGFIPQRRKD